MPYIIKHVVIAFDENDPPVQLRTDNREVDKTAMVVIMQPP